MLEDQAWDGTTMSEAGTPVAIAADLGGAGVLTMTFRLDPTAAEGAHRAIVFEHPDGSAIWPVLDR
ncbi:MAG: hypothetical protein U0667_08330 [Chloroflexota bacterium]